MSAGRILADLSVAPAILIVFWSAAALPLLLAGQLRPVPAIGLFAALVGGAVTWGIRHRRNDRPVKGTGTAPRVAVPWWSPAGVAAVAVAFLALQLLMCSEQIIVRRDPAAYIQFAGWLKGHGTLPIPRDLAAFGGGDPALDFASPGFFAYDGAIVPQFMVGLPLLLTAGGWIGGIPGMLVVTPILGACAVLSFGGLVARFVGPRWAPAGALLLACTLPMMWASRSAYSEIPALVLLTGGLALLHDAYRSEGRAARVRAFLAGAALGTTVLVRIDGLRDVLPVVVFAGLLAAAGAPLPGPGSRRLGVPLLVGLGLGAGAGLAAGFSLSRPYLSYIRASLEPLLVITAGVLALTTVLVLVLRSRGVERRARSLAGRLSRRPWPEAAAGLVLLVSTGLAVRPYLQQVERVPGTEEDKATATYIEYLQRLSGLPVNGTRQYYENSLHWVAWYIGIPALLAAVLAAALLLRRLLRGRDREWTLPFAMIAWTTATTLWRPGITPDQPWASRRLLPVVLPGLLLLALWGGAWAVRRLRRRGRDEVFLRRASVTALVLVVAPSLAVAAPLAVSPTERGSVGAVDRLCDRIGGNRTVIFVEENTGKSLSQIVRGTCGRPAARMAPGAAPDDVRRVMSKIQRAGRRPLVIGGKPSDVAAYGPAVQVVALRFRQDPHSLTAPPGRPWNYRFDVWMAEPQGQAAT
ncbi:hypothetical protein [Actinomadura rubrisoli]|uniref:Glycosyltransferase RgtA/B/C/D-like domain-containing protein n=1 Tax=Actinomadura rubrisoli TaxID=2530368 RepID=A0A4R5C155_9ACTN|nr:hypothetical protein [Actinomadura rubrisoli]TDD90494.1 hypothetical protein E1298_12905 [Actinomadura rubrisoli]